MLTLCKIHNQPEHHLISIRLNQVRQGNLQQKCKAIKVIVYNIEDSVVMNSHTYYVADTELGGFVSFEHGAELFLYDRDKIKKEPNVDILF